MSSTPQRMDYCSPTFRLNQRGYAASDVELACDLHLFPFAEKFGSAAIALGERFVYQINVMRRTYDREEERAVRKRTAALQFNHNLPEPIRILQIALNERLLEAQYLAEEFFSFESLHSRSQAESELKQYFLSHMERFGFRDPPVEQGEINELLRIG